MDQQQDLTINNSDLLNFDINKMFLKIKNKNINIHKITLLLIFFLVISFGFGRGEKVEAAGDDLGHCFTNTELVGGGEDSSYETIWEEYNITEDDCTTKCAQKKIDIPTIKTCRWKNSTASSLTAGKVVVSDNSCSVKEWASGSFVNCFLLMILNFLVSILQLSTSLFVWILKPENITAVLGSTAIYSAWTTVRDILNISFIMFLLFSAFATVFQIDKYSYKKILLTLVIMALLVNFSFPISRFIIDVSNMMMYYFADALNIDGAKTMVGFADATQLPNIIYSDGIKDANTTMLFTSVIFVFILAVTLITVAILFVIRTIALAILIIFSSLAFVGAAIPPLSSYANDWWKKLFSYAFFGPIMLFMIYVSSKLIIELAKVEGNSMKTIATTQSNKPEFIAALSLFVIPIVILWMGLGIAQSMSIAGAGAVVGKAQGFLKWSGRTLTGYRAIKAGSLAGLKAVDRNTLGKWGLSPRQIMHGWKESTKEAEDSKLSYGKGLWHDRINRIFSFGKTKTNYAEIARQALTSKKTKQLQEVSDESAYILDRMSDLMGNSSPEAVAEMKGIFRTIYSNNDQDELMGYIKDNIQKGTPIGKKFAEKLKFNKDNWGVSEKNVSNAVIKIFQESGMGDEELNKELLDLGNIAAGKQGVGFAAVFYNPETKKFERIAGVPKYNGMQGLQTALKMMTMGEAQNIPKQMHRNNFTDQEGNLNESGKALLRKYASPTAIKHAERHKPDFYKSICKDNDGIISKKMLKYAADLKNGKADGWREEIRNPDGSVKTEEGYVDGISDGIQDTRQAYAAAAWTAALQNKSGIPKTAIEKNLSDAGFDSGEITNIMKMSKGPEA